MSRILFTIIALIISAITSFAALRFNGAQFPPVSIETTAATGIDAVYVVNTTIGLSAVYTASSISAIVDVATYGMRGAVQTETVDPTNISRNGKELTITNLKPDCGYVFTEDGRTTYYWITDYSAHPYDISALNISPEQDCDRTSLFTEGKAPSMSYYSISGRAYEIDREIILTYSTLIPDTENISYSSAEQKVSLKHIDGIFSVEVPLCDTYFTLSGDKFLREWGMEQDVTSERFLTNSVRAVTKATQTQRNSENEIKVDATLGGSAPSEIHFEAAITDAAIFTQWQMARDEEFQEITLQMPDLDFTYTFTEMGTTFVRFMVADATGQCEYYGDTYTITIGESHILCPNAFSPGASEGVNDEWKVSYKSIVNFECYIFNRWGEKMAEFHDPSQGWDGKYGGKLVPAGVYYYVIKATGSDGKNYNLSGDINILRYTDR